MSYYARFTPYLLASTLPDRSTNSLPVPDDEDFIALKTLQVEVFVNDAGDAPVSTGIYLDGWTSGVSYGSVTDFVPFVARITNTGTQYFWVQWVPVDDNTATSAGSQYTSVLPGQTVILYARKSADQYNNPSSFPGALNLQAPATTPGGTASVTLLQLDAQTVIDALA